MGEPFPCPAPDCTTTFERGLPENALQSMIDLHARTAHPITNNGQITASTSKCEKVKRPIIAAQGTSEDWNYFSNRWLEYKQATKLQGQDILHQLLECCDDSLRKDITRTHGTLTNETEEDALLKIRRLAVRPENILVSRVQLYSLRQDRDEPIRSFVARLRGQSSICQFQKSKLCSCSLNVEVDYSSEMIRDAMIKGLEDEDIRLDILAQGNQTLSLEDAVQLVEAKESGKRSALRLYPDANTSTNATSSYKRGNQHNLQNQRRADHYNKPPTYNKSSTYNKPSTHNNQPATCSHCGESGHGNGRFAPTRKRCCPAYNHTCEKCGVLHHLESMCRNSNKQNLHSSSAINHNQADQNTNQDSFFNDAIFEQICSATQVLPTLDSCNLITLDHHIYDDICNSWRRRQSDPQPCINISVGVVPSDTEHIGIKPTLSADAPTNTVPYIAMADTGCQSCLAGFDLLTKLNIKKTQLIPVSMKMTAANNQSIEIAGALPLRITGISPSKTAHTTKQLVYFTPSARRLFLSKNACRSLGLISNNITTIGEMHAADDVKSKPQTCQCPVRQPPPPPPTSLPYPATEENREKLEKYLLDYYKASTFNTCQHQPLPMMTGPPLRLMIDKDAKPSVTHKPIPIPVHWQEEIYDDLKQDVSLGVIEPVPVGTPVTWCHRMVVVPKKSGKPRRTVDLQPLNKYATRETHHTETPFHQARAVPPNTLKTICDAWNGYHSIPLHEEDKHLTTFITPIGRYRYCVAPQGYIASGDGYTRRFDDLIVDLPRKTKCVDDTLMWSESLSEAFFHTVDFLNLCGNNGVILNPNKFHFAKPTVEFAGFEITLNSVKPCHRTLAAIQDFPTSKNITDVRSWFGLVNQVSYAFASADRMLPFRSLLKPGKTFEWSETLDQLFNESKALIVQEIQDGVEIFDKRRPTCLATDWCKDGIGFLLLQKHCRCESIQPLCCKTGWKTTLVGSRFHLHPQLNLAMHQLRERL